MYYPKDFIATAEGLIFAVVAEGTENGAVLCFLRYVPSDLGFRKLSSDQAKHFLAQHYAGFLHYSTIRDAHLHAVPVAQIIQHYQPRRRLQELLKSPVSDPVIEDLLTLIRLFQEQGLDISQVGITGSLLIDAQQAGSDLDLVFYDRQSFNQARRMVSDLITGQRLSVLNHIDWQDAYARRDCEISFDDYVWHERRKFNKVIVNGRKADLSLLIPGFESNDENFRKQGFIDTVCRVIEADSSFAYPAEYGVDAEAFQKIVCYTATYNGQALAGEWVHVAGQLELSDTGQRRVVVGSSREARGEFITVIKANA